MSDVIVSVRAYVLVWAALMALLAATVGVDMVDLGWGNTALALCIAILKAALVGLFFMHLRYAKRGLEWVFALAGVFWLGILLTLAMGDYSTRENFGETNAPIAPLEE